MVIDDFIFFLSVPLIGYFASAGRLLPTDVEKVLPHLLMNISYPALILATFTQMNINQLMSTGLFVAMATWIITLILFVLSKPAVKHVALDRKARLRFQLGVGNVIYVSMPLLLAFFGPKVLYIVIIHSAAQDILIWLLYYPMVLGMKGKQKNSALSYLVKSPCMVALLIAIILVLFPYKLPSFATLLIDRLSLMASPLALLYLGRLIHKYGVWQWIKNRAAIKFALSKSFLMPFLVTGILAPFTDWGTAIMLGLLFGAPAPIMSIVWAEHHEGDVSFAVDSCIGSTLIYISFASIVSFVILQFRVITF